MTTATQRETYALAVLDAARTLQVRFPGRVPLETIGALADDFVRERLDPRDVAEGVRGLARSSSFYDEHLLRHEIGQARERRTMEEARRTPVRALSAANDRDPIDVRAGQIAVQILASAIATRAAAFRLLPEHAISARMTQIREQAAEAIRAEPQVTDAELVRRFGGGA